MQTVVILRSTQPTKPSDLVPGSEMNLAQTLQNIQLANHPCLAMTDKHNKKARKQSELFSKRITDLAAHMAQLKSVVQELRRYNAEALSF